MTENVLAYLLKTKGQAYVMNLLGLNKKQDNPKYSISIAGNSFNPMKMLKRAGLNKLFSSGSSMLGPLAVGAGLMYLGNKTNPLKEGSYNYNPNLRGQLDYAGAAGLLARNPNHGGLIYGPNSVLSGKNAIHGGRKTDYRGHLQNFIDKQQAIKDRGYNKYSNIPFTETQQRRLNEAKTEQDNFDWDQVDKDMAEKEKTKNRKTYSAPYQGKVHDNDGGAAPDRSKSDNQPGGFTSKDSDRENYSRYAQGGIASL